MEATSGPGVGGKVGIEGRRGRTEQGLLRDAFIGEGRERILAQPLIAVSMEVGVKEGVRAELIGEGECGGFLIIDSALLLWTREKERPGGGMLGICQEGEGG